MLCVLMVEGMSGVVNVMLSLMNVTSPPPNLCNLPVRTVMRLWWFCFRGELGVLDCDDICDVNKCFDLLEFVLFLIPFVLT